MRVLLKFRKESVEQPITSRIILEQGTQINILTAQINQEGGEILAEIDASKAQKVIESYRQQGVDVEVRELIEVNSDKCTECGSCYSLCPVDAIAYQQDASIVFFSRNCLGASCGLCVDACPTRAIKLIS